MAGGKEVQDNEGRMDETKEGRTENGVTVIVGFVSFLWTFTAKGQNVHNASRLREKMVSFFIFLYIFLLTDDDRVEDKK